MTAFLETETKKLSIKKRMVNKEVRKKGKGKGKRK